MPLPRDIVAALARRLAERAGLELPAWVVESRAQARMNAIGVHGAAYVELVSSGRGEPELAELIEAVRVGETRFFRQRAQVDALIDVVVPALAARTGARRAIKVWSAGCASGEEPYTLALVLGRLLPDHAISIVATDVSDDALAVARRGVYPRAALDHVPEDWRDGFDDAGDDVRVADAVRRRVTFERSNLVDGEAPKGCALVWCRNVLIYFAPDARKRAVDRLVGALEPDGFLFVGYSEQLREVAGLDAERAGEAVVYVKRTPVPRRTPSAGIPVKTPAAGVPVAIQDRHRATTKAHVVTSTTLRIENPATLAVQIRDALASHVSRLTIDLDAAAVLSDDVAPILRRARAAAEAAGATLVLAASRPGTLRWLRRHGLEAFLA